LQAKKLKQFLEKTHPEAVQVKIQSTITWLDTGIPALNAMISGLPKTGGFPLSGKTTVMFGPEGCVTGDTFIYYRIFDIKEKKIVFNKGGTIKELYSKFTGIEEEKRYLFFIKSIDEDLSFVLEQPILQVVNSGSKECFEIVTELGKKIKTTKDHKYFVGNRVFKSLGELNIGDSIFILENGSGFFNDKPHSDECYETFQDKIISITPIGIQETYDIKCFMPNNYIANDIVVHNSGKTSIMLQLMSQAQKAGVTPVWIDSERTIMERRIKDNFDIDIDNLVYIKPNSMEEVFEIIDKICANKIKDADKDPLMVVWDSVAATPTADEMNRKADQQEIASQARVLSRNMRRIRSMIDNAGIGLFMINQARSNQSQYGDVITMSGGYALKHNCDVIIRVSKVSPDEIGQTINLSVPGKNRLFTPHRKTSVKFEYISGFTRSNVIESLKDLLVEGDILGKSGAWCYLNTEVDLLMRENKLSKKEAVKAAKKFYASEFTARLISDPEYYDKTLQEIEDYMVRNTYKISQALEENSDEEYDDDGLDGYIVRKKERKNKKEEKFDDDDEEEKDGDSIDESSNNTTE